MEKIDPTYYDEEYFLKGTKSGYGGRFSPYVEETFLPIARNIASGIKVALNPNSAFVLGCARGYLVHALRDEDIIAYGIDISEWAVENCDTYAKPFIMLGDITKDLYRMEPLSFDLVIAHDVLEHISKKELPFTIREICRITKNHVLLNVPTNDNGVDKSHVSILPRHWWFTQFTMNGFSVLREWEEFEQMDGIVSLRVTFKRK